ncbi:MAG TPA: CBS domain-containing protein [Candidatus Limnocylindria bacterium]|nr:CBS domain-containing protein [Candidatus Limnocylindria bacterium]
MQVREIMSEDPVCCAPTTPIVDVACMMVEEDCGEIPVCDDTGKPVGVVTDRDIACRVVAKRKDPVEETAEDCMSSPVVTVRPDSPIEEAVQLMEQYQVRRLPVVGDDGACCGIVSQADLARKGPREASAEVVSKVSEPNVFASSVGGRPG